MINAPSRTFHPIMIKLPDPGRKITTQLRPDRVGQWGNALMGALIVCGVHGSVIVQKYHSSYVIAGAYDHEGKEHISQMATVVIK